MATVIHCPECGGIIGATEITDAGRPCICFNEDKFDNADASSEDSKSDTSMLGEAQPKKVCCQCGKDLRGHRRLKDERGYWCVNCHKEDERVNGPLRVRCAGCSRKVPPNTLEDYDGIKLCLLCRKERLEVAKQKRRFSKVGDKYYKSQDLKRLMIMLGVVVLLLVIIYLGRAGIL